MNYIKSTETGCLLMLTVRAGASADKIVGPYDNRLKIKISAPPEDGKANKAIQKFFSKKLGISKSEIQIIKGTTSQNKKLSLNNISKYTLLQKLGLVKC
ncbi:MAG: DUF167 domain-containing protein [Verrucomicrobiota bacterium]|nr:DUF167 domain-containing protein [Verrucomicrobiota bacterium]